MRSVLLLCVRSWSFGAAAAARDAVSAAAAGPKLARYPFGTAHITGSRFIIIMCDP